MIMSKEKAKLFKFYCCIKLKYINSFHDPSQDYKDILLKRIHQLHNMRHQPNQFTVLVREIPLCDEHKARDCCVDHFFSKYHPHSYQSYQILYDGRDLEKLSVRLLWHTN